MKKRSYLINHQINVNPSLLEMYEILTKHLVELLRLSGMALYFQMFNCYFLKLSYMTIIIFCFISFYSSIKN